MNIKNKIKCVVWDLDNTLWNGVLSEADNIFLKPLIKNMVKTLDTRGVLQSIASKNDFDLAMNKLKEFGIEKYFLYPEIHWNAKSLSVGKIKENLNIGIDSILFIDDQLFELEEVASVYPDINILSAELLDGLLDNPHLKPDFVTVDSVQRRRMYQQDYQRKKAEQAYQGPTESFLASLNMKLFIYDAKEEDLQRAEELTVRVNQLNATGQSFSYDELNEFRQSDSHKLLICELNDKYGSYGKIGLALISLYEDYWQLDLLLVSCRVISRGVGTILLNYIIGEALGSQKILLANFKKTGSNRMMEVAFRFSGFKQISSGNGGSSILQYQSKVVPSFPDYVEISYREAELEQLDVI